jgi:hypothetical protein
VSTVDSADRSDSEIGAALRAYASGALRHAERVHAAMERVSAGRFPALVRGAAGLLACARELDEDVKGRQRGRREHVSGDGGSGRDGEPEPPF